MRVVHCKKEPYTVYIGRPGPFGNPFKVGLFPRGQAVREFDKYARRNDRLLLLIEALPADAVLGCWCAPRLCHGDVIRAIWHELHNT